MIQKILFSLLLVLFASYFNELFAAGMGMGPPNPPCGVGGFPPCPSTVPIDGGIVFLAGAGMVLSARKMMKKK